MLTVITTGGESRRMGRDKAELPLGDGTFLTRLIGEYGKSGDVAISVREPGMHAYGVPELVDPFPGEGPLNALIAAFEQTDAEAVFLTAVDLPFGDASLARQLYAMRGVADACVIRRADGTEETLFAVYGRSCLKQARSLIETGVRSFRALLESMQVRIVREEELTGHDLARILKNVNTGADYAAALQIEKESAAMNPLMNRRSVRRFNDRPVEKEKIERLLRAAMQAPSGKDTRPWEFIVVTEPETKEAVSTMSEFSGMCRFAPVLILCLADLTKDENEDWVAQNMACCTSNILHQAVLEGLGATYLGFYPRPERIEKMREYFHLPEHILPFSVVPVGYTDKVYEVKDRFDEAKIHWERWD